MSVKTVSSQSKSCDKCKGEWIGNDALVTQHAPRRVCQPLVITSRWKPLPESTTSTLLWEEAFISKSLHNTTLNLFCNAVRCCSGLINGHTAWLWPLKYQHSSACIRCSIYSAISALCLSRLMVPLLGRWPAFFVSFDSCDHQLRYGVCSKERLKWIVVALNIASAIGVAFN